MALSQKGRIMAEYVWIDSELDVRSKVRTLEYKEGGYTPEDLPTVSAALPLLCFAVLTRDAAVEL